MPYNGSTEIASGLKQMGTGNYALIDAKDVRVTDEKRLDATLEDINDALDAKPDTEDVIANPATAGTEGQHLQIDAQGNPVWVDPGTPTDTQVGNAVSDWLDDHPEATTTVEDGAISYDKLNDDMKGRVDSIGEISGLKSSFNGTLIPWPADWQRKVIASSDGSETDNFTRLSTIGFIPAQIVRLVCADGYKFAVYVYDGTTYLGIWDGANVEKTGAWQTGSLLIGPVRQYNIRLVLAKSDNTGIVIADASNIALMGSMVPDRVAMQRGVLTNANDFDAAVFPGMYYCDASSIPDNSPVAESGVLVVDSVESYVVHTYYAASGQYSRMKNGSIWTEWIRTATDTDVANLEAETADITGNQYIRMIDGYYIALSTSTTDIENPTPSTGTNQYQYGVVACAPGDIFTVSATGGNSARAWGFVAADGETVIKTSAANASISNVEIVAPENAAWLVINNYNHAKRSYKGRLIKASVDNNAEYIRAINDSMAIAGPDLEWETGKAINSSGTIVNNANYSALSGLVSAADAYKYTGAVSDGTTAINVFVHEYNDQQEWQRRTALYTGTAIVIDPATKYVRFTFAYGASSGATMTQEIIAAHFSVQQMGSLQDLKSQISSIEENVGNLSNGLELLNGQIWATEDIPVSSASIYGLGFLDAQGIFQAYGALTDNMAFYPIPAGVSGLSIKAHSTNGSNYTLTQTTNHTSGTSPDYATGYNLRTNIDAGETVVIMNIPEDAKYIYYAIKNSRGDATPEITAIFSRLDVIEKVLTQKIQNYVGHLVSSFAFGINANSRDIPKNRGIMNALRKLEQVTQVQYTLLSKLPRIGTGIWEPEGEQTGVIYSSVKEKAKFVGFDVSLLTYITAVHNPRSLLYTEDVMASRSKSEYGFVYHGTDACGPYYGMVCSSFVNLATGMKIKWETIHYDYLARIGIFTDVKDVSAYGVQLGDILWKTGHTVIITDIYRDSRGLPTSITYSEAVAKNVRNVTLNSANAFNNFLATGNYTHIYRYNYFDDNLEYEPSPFVTIDDELGTAESYTFNDNICTFAGDYAAFRVGDTIYLNVLDAENYTQIVIDDGTNTDSIAIVAGQTDYDITSKVTHGGLYTAYLTDGTNNSAPTHFEGVEATITATKEDGLTTIAVNQSANPLYIRMSDIAGAMEGAYDIIDNASQYTFNADAICIEQSGKAKSQRYYAVVYQGQYGKVLSEMILL